MIRLKDFDKEEIFEIVKSMKNNQSDYRAITIKRNSDGTFLVISNPYYGGVRVAREKTIGCYEKYIDINFKVNETFDDLFKRVIHAIHQL